MNDRWWAIRREQDLRDRVALKNQFIDKIEAILDEYENSPDKLNSKIREAIENYRKLT